MADDGAGSPPCDDFKPHAFKPDLCADCKRTKSSHGNHGQSQSNLAKSLKPSLQRASTIQPTALASRPTLKSSASIEGKHVGFTDGTIIISTEGGVGSTDSMGIERYTDEDDDSTPEDLKNAIEREDKQLAIETVRNTRRNSTTVGVGGGDCSNSMLQATGNSEDLEEMYRGNRFRKVSGGRRSPPPRLMAEDVPRDSVGAPTPMHYYNKYDIEMKGNSGTPIPIVNDNNKVEEKPHEDNSSDVYHLYEDLDDNNGCSNSMESNRKSFLEKKQKVIAEEVRVWKTFDERFGGSPPPDSRLAAAKKNGNNTNNNGGSSFFKRLFRRNSERAEESDRIQFSKVPDSPPIIINQQSSSSSSPLQLRKSQFQLKQDDFVPRRSNTSSTKLPIDSETDSGRTSTIDSTTSSSSDVVILPPTTTTSIMETSLEAIVCDEEPSLMDQILEEVPLSSETLLTKSPVVVKKTKSVSISVEEELLDRLNIDIPSSSINSNSAADISPKSPNAPLIQAPRKPRHRSELSGSLNRNNVKSKVHQQRMNAAPPPPPGRRLSRPSSPPPLPPETNDNNNFSSSIHATLPRSSAARIGRQREENNRSTGLRITNHNEAESVLRNNNNRSRNDSRNSRRTVTEGVKLDLDLAGTENKRQRVKELLDTFPRKFADRKLPSPPAPMPRRDITMIDNNSILPSSGGDGLGLDDVYETVGEESSNNQETHRLSATYLEPISCAQRTTTTIPECPAPLPKNKFLVDNKIINDNNNDDHNKNVRDFVPEINFNSSLITELSEIQQRCVRNLCKSIFVRNIKSNLPNTFTDYFISEKSLLVVDRMVFMKAKPLLGDQHVVLMISKIHQPSTTTTTITACQQQQRRIKHPHVVNSELTFTGFLLKEDLPLEFLENPLERQIETEISVLNCDNLQTIRDVVYALYIDVDPSQYGRECAKLFEQILSACSFLKTYGMHCRLNYGQVLVSSLESGEKYAIVFPSQTEEESAKNGLELMEHLLPTSTRPEALRNAILEKDYRTAHILLCVMLWGPADVTAAIQNNDYAERWILLQKAHLLALTATGDVSRLESNRRANFLNNLTVNLLQQCLRRLKQV